MVLIEPIYELASPEAQSRMRQHCYVRGLKNIAEGIGVKVSDYRLLEFTMNHLNPSGLILIEKDMPMQDGEKAITWRCP